MSRDAIDQHAKELAELKATWEDGPWQTEPDRVEWRSHGLPCLIQRNSFGAWCGYVGIPRDHPLHGKDFQNVAADVHGDLTYSGEPCELLSFMLEPGEHEGVPIAPAAWVFGFDCSHGWDFSPGVHGSLLFPSFLPERFRPEYRDIAYVTRETERLAAELDYSATHPDIEAWLREHLKTEKAN